MPPMIFDVHGLIRIGEAEHTILLAVIRDLVITRGKG